MRPIFFCLMSENSQGFIRNLAEMLAKREDETPKRTGAKPDLFGVSLVQVINLDNFLARCFRTRLK